MKEGAGRYPGKHNSSGGRTRPRRGSLRTCSRRSDAGTGCVTVGVRAWGLQGLGNEVAAAEAGQVGVNDDDGHD